VCVWNYFVVVAEGVAVLVIPPPLRMRIILDVMAAAAAEAACDCIGLAASREGSCLRLRW